MEEFGQPEPTEDTPIYISPYEIKQPRKPRKTEEEIKQKKREIALKHYYENYEYKRLQHKYMLKIIQISYQKNREFTEQRKSKKIILIQKKHKFNNTIF